LFIKRRRQAARVAGGVPAPADASVIPLSDPAFFQAHSERRAPCEDEQRR